VISVFVGTLGDGDGAMSRALTSKEVRRLLKHGELEEYGGCGLPKMIVEYMVFGPQLRVNVGPSFSSFMFSLLSL
jgi:hypothetical protein